MLTRTLRRRDPRRRRAAVCSFVTAHYCSDSSPFIPLPLLVGTLGAFIRMEDEPRDRRHLFDIAVAGPLAGLAASLVVLVAGLAAGAQPGAAPAVDPSSSLLLGLLSRSLGYDATALAVHPLVFAGWLGLMLTAFNLVPVGNLDGGHMARALFGERAAQWLGRGALIVLVALGLVVSHAFLLWAAVAFAVGGASARSADDGDDVHRSGPLADGSRLVLGAASLALIALILLPMPAVSASLGGLPCS